MLTFSRIRSIFFTEAPLECPFSDAEDEISRRDSGQSSCRRQKSRNHRIEKTSGKRQRFSGFANVRWRDESVALPDTLHRRERARRLIR